MAFHTVIIVGNLGRDPEMRYTPSGQAVTSFSVAASERYTNSSGERIDRTVWFRISAWGKQAENCNQYLHKGNKVLVEGRLVADEKGNPRVFTRNDGSSGASFEVSASTVRFLTSRAEEESQTGESYGQAVAESDEIPF
ncbi:MAG TPA: single-stranded DNA-binding protein [Anaerolineales bacterium]|nr:single-stranded DNA-binding protein [Anaerolineales bacterium]